MYVGIVCTYNIMYDFNPSVFDLGIKLLTGPKKHNLIHFRRRFSYQNTLKRIMEPENYAKSFNGHQKGFFRVAFYETQRHLNILYDTSVGRYKINHSVRIGTIPTLYSNVVFLSSSQRGTSLISDGNMFWDIFGVICFGGECRWKGY